LNLVHYDKHIIDSVICHELAHYFVLGHSKKFYKILLGVVPDYWDSRKKLINNVYA
jgi:predicted metal-dependent hydrolase